jgi:hypothetical protein
MIWSRRWLTEIKELKIFILRRIYFTLLLVELDAAVVVDVMNALVVEDH